jgi:cell wall-associated NlpC family hydrolase
VTFRRRIAMFSLAAAAGILAVPALPAQAAPGATATPTITSASPAATVISSNAAAALGAVGTNRFPAQLDSLASSVAATLKIDPAALLAAWQAADAEHQVALVAALGQLGVPYKRNTSKPGVGFDCSGLTTYAWAQAGYTLPRQSSAQMKAAAKRARDTAQAGDLVQYPGHVMMYLGVENFVVHSPFTGRNVEVTSISKRKLNSLRWGDPTG